MVAIPRHHEEVSVLHCCDRLAVRATATAFSGDVTTKPSRGSYKERCFRRARRYLDRIPRVGLPSASSEQARVGTVQALGHRWIDHVEEHDLSLWRGDFGNGIDTRRPGSVGEPRDDLH